MSRFRASDLRGSARMAVQATAGVARVVEGVHQSVLGSMGLPGGTEPGRTRGLTGMVYQGIHGITRLVDQGLQQLASVQGQQMRLRIALQVVQQPLLVHLRKPRGVFE